MTPCGGRATPRTTAWGRRANQPAVQLGALAILLAGTAVLLFHLTRGSSFLNDDWSFVLNRHGSSLATYLDPHNRHFSLVPVAIYKLVFATFGISSYVPLRVVLIACDLLLLALLWRYARPRVGAWAALVLTALLALLGPGWEDFLWPFQIGFVLPMCAGIGALLALERRTTHADALACALTLLALASSGVGIPVALGVAVDIVVDVRRRRRLPTDIWVVAIPAALFIAWWIGYQGGSGIGGFGQAPNFIEKEAASVMASLLGRAGPVGLDGPGTLSAWGTPLLIVAAALVIWRVARGGPVPPRVLAPATMLLTFWVATALNSEGIFANPYTSRYIYVGATFVLLVAVELARGCHPSRLVIVALPVIAAIAIGSNVGELRTAAAMVRGFGQDTTADLGALEIARRLEPAGYIAQELPGYPLIQLPAHEFFKITTMLGNPAASVATIEADQEPSKEIVDRELLAIHRVAPVPVARGFSPLVKGCVRLIRPGASSFSITRRDFGLLIRAGARPVNVSVRRFAVLAQPVGTVPPRTPATIRMAPDLSTVPWHVQLSSAGPVTACGL